MVRQNRSRPADPSRVQLSVANTRKPAFTDDSLLSFRLRKAAAACGNRSQMRDGRAALIRHRIMSVSIHVFSLPNNNTSGDFK